MYVCANLSRAQCTGIMVRPRTLDMSLDGEFGAQVIVGPIRIVLPSLDQRDVERSEACADVGQILVEAGVA